MGDTDNLAIWNQLSKTDPKQTKAFKRAGGFTGTAIKPIYQLQKMTEVFGPAGEGWGTSEPEFQVVSGVNQEVLVFCTVGLWVNETGTDKWVYGVGGDKVVTHIKANQQYNRPERWENDDEAFKKAFTDAVGNAMKHLGMSADVHMGLFDDSKYVREREAEEAGADRSTGEIASEPSGKPVQADPEPLPVPTKQGLKNTAQRDLWGRLVKATRECKSIEDLNKLWDHAASKAAYENFPPDWRVEMDMEVNDKEAELSERLAKLVKTP